MPFCSLCKSPYHNKRCCSVKQRTSPTQAYWAAHAAGSKVTAEMCIRAAAITPPWNDARLQDPSDAACYIGDDTLERTCVAKAATRTRGARAKVRARGREDDEQKYETQSIRCRTTKCTRPRDRGNAIVCRQCEKPSLRVRHTCSRARSLREKRAYSGTRMSIAKEKKKSFRKKPLAVETRVLACKINRISAPQQPVCRRSQKAMPKRRPNETPQQRDVRLQKKRKESQRRRGRIQADPVRKNEFLAQRRSYRKSKRSAQSTEQRQKKREESQRRRKRIQADPTRYAEFLAKKRRYRERKRRSLQSAKNVDV